jgi:hypothetical protein
MLVDWAAGVIGLCLKYELTRSYRAIGGKKAAREQQPTDYRCRVADQ